MVVVFVGIIASILAISVRAMMVNAQVSRVTETWDILESVRLATFNSAAAATDRVFRQRVGSVPGQLSELIGPIDSNDAANYPDLCGFGFNNTQRNNWRNWGPFLGRTFNPADGLATPMGNLDNDFIRTVIGGTIYLTVVITVADLNDIDLMDRIFDNDDGAAAGAVRWDTISGTTARLTYMITADNSC